VCVCVCVCVSVCPDNKFPLNDLWRRYVARWFTLTMYGPSSKVKVTEFAVTEGNKTSATAETADRGVARAENK